jgi:hypothetical protein
MELQQKNMKTASSAAAVERVETSTRRRILIVAVLSPIIGLLMQ